MVDLPRRGNTLSLQVCVCMRACVGGKLTEGICRLLCVGEVVSESLDKCWEKILCKREVREHYNSGHLRWKCNTNRNTLGL